MGRKGKSGDKAHWKKPVTGILLGGGAALALLALSSYQPRAGGLVGGAGVGAVGGGGGAGKLGVAGGTLAIKGAAAAISRVRETGIGFDDEDLEAGDDARIVEPSRRFGSRKFAAEALALAAA